MCYISILLVKCYPISLYFGFKPPYDLPHVFVRHAELLARQVVGIHLACMLALFQEVTIDAQGSPPLRRNDTGLHQTVELLGINGLVAPLAGAWIETYRMSRYLLELRVAPTGGALCKTSIDILVSVTWFLLVSRLKRSCVSIVI